MSRAQAPGICYCECHGSGVMMMHCAPCCLGKCPVCKKHYKDEEHARECQQRIEELAAQVEA